jgi:hypothetical protein
MHRDQKPKGEVRMPQSKMLLQSNGNIQNKKMLTYMGGNFCKPYI